MLQQPSWLSICPQLDLVTGVKVIIGLYIVAIKEKVTYDRTAPPRPLCSARWHPAGRPAILI